MHLGFALKRAPSNNIPKKTILQVIYTKKKMKICFTSEDSFCKPNYQLQHTLLHLPVMFCFSHHGNHDLPLPQPNECAVAAGWRWRKGGGASIFWGGEKRNPRSDPFLGVFIGFVHWYVEGFLVLLFFFVECLECVVGSSSFS